MPRVVGLTGGIGTGKSTVAQLFEKRGARIVDADAIVHELQAPGAPLHDEILETFGERFRRPDGSLDRKALGAHVFADPEARATLARLTGGPIVAELARRVAEARGSDAPLVLVDVPLLFESARKARDSGRPTTADAVDGVILVYAPEALQIERQQARDGASAEHATQRMRAQMPIDEKRELADWVIENGGDLRETERQVDELFRTLTGEEPSSQNAG